jgi:acetylornithine deacetylase/succinyl-diaminopimelate desuccinylase-like protein
MARASDKRNVVPGLCEITVDCRLLPGQTPEQALAEVRAWFQGIVGDGAYELETIEAQGGTRSPAEGPLWDAVASWVEATEPDAVLAPICVAGFTDSHWVREAFGTVAYGFFPARTLAAETAARLVHSADERVPVADLELGLAWLLHAARTVCA